MTDRANIKLPREDYERHNERRQEMGLSWADYIDGQAPEYPDASVDEKVLAEYVADYLVEGTELPRRVAEEVRG